MGRKCCILCFSAIDNLDGKFWQLTFSTFPVTRILFLSAIFAESLLFGWSHESDRGPSIDQLNTNQDGAEEGKCYVRLMNIYIFAFQVIFSESVDLFCWVLQ